MTALAGALALTTLVVGVLAVDLLRAHGRLVRSLEALDPQVDVNPTPLPLIQNPRETAATSAHDQERSQEPGGIEQHPTTLEE